MVQVDAMRPYWIAEGDRGYGNPTTRDIRWVLEARWYVPPDAAASVQESGAEVNTSPETYTKHDTPNAAFGAKAVLTTALAEQPQASDWNIGEITAATFVRRCGVHVPLPPSSIGATTTWPSTFCGDNYVLSTTSATPMQERILRLGVMNASPTA